MFQSVGRIWLSLLFCSVAVFGAHPNKKVIITDVLDDDIRSIVHLLGDPEYRNSVEAFVVTTGNVQLKAAFLRKIVAGLGLEIPVWVGTSTDLSKSPITSFAANLEKEGYPLLSEAEIIAFKRMNGIHGDASIRLAQLFQRHRNQDLDIVFLTSPLDFNKAVRLDVQAAQRAVGDGFGMGFYKLKGDGSRVLPFNAALDPTAIDELAKAHEAGLFEHFYHVRTDTIQQRSGLPGGYVPVTEEGMRVRAELEAAMGENPVLNQILHAAREYNLAWRSSAIADFGVGFNDSDRWVPSSFSDPQMAVGFYLADTVPVALSKMDRAELARQDWNSPRVSLTGSSNGRVFHDLQSFNGASALNEHVAIAKRTVAYAALPSFSQPAEAKASSHSDVLNLPRTHSDSLVIVFKNSPDDWFALLRVLTTEQGREALVRGGIIVEGFETEAVAQAVRSFLADLGEHSIPVAQGHTYQEGEVDAIANFKGERFFYQTKQGVRGFEALKPPGTPDSLTPTQLLERAARLAFQQGGKIDTLILGEGVDLFEAIRAKPGLRDHFRSHYVMGGGRLVEGEFKLSRNWLRQPKFILDGLEDLARHGQNVFVFSSQDFGGSIVSQDDGKAGNGTVALTKLDELAQTVPAIKAVADHWRNWSRAFKHVMSQSQDPFNPNEEVKIVTISPLGLTIADEWVLQQLENNQSALRAEAVSLQSLHDGVAPGEQGFVKWLRRDGGQEIVPLARRFSDSIARISTTVAASEHHHAVRDRSIFDPLAEETLKKISGSGVGNGFDDCGLGRLSDNGGSH